jgi:hypothetical protein
MSLNSNSANNSNTNLNLYNVSNSTIQQQQPQHQTTNVILQTLKRRINKTVIPLDDRVSNK